MNKTVEEYLNQNKNEKVIFDCENCGKHTEKNYKTFRKNPYLLCKSCLMLKLYGAKSNMGRPEVKAKKQNTFNEKYGGSPMKSKEVQEKVKATTIKNYGVDNIFKNKDFIKTNVENKNYQEIQKKIKETNLKKYGVPCTLQVPEIQEKIKNTNLEKYGVEYTLQSYKIRNKAKETCIKRYGTEYATQCDEIKKKIKETNIKNIGVEFPSQNKEVQEKIKNTNLEKYGVECTLKSDKVKEKIDNTNLKKYGTIYPIQNKEIKEKLENTCMERYGNPTYLMSDEYHSKAHNKYRYKGEIFDSSWELAYWIFCEDNNIDLHRNTNAFILESGNRTYFDFISNGKYIEIKGDYLKNLDNWKFKEKAYRDNNVIVLFKKDMEPILKYIYNRYGSNYLKKFKDKSNKDFKRDIIEVHGKTQDDLEKYKNKNVRFHYICKNCGKDVFTTYKLLNHFNDCLCKQCRKNEIKNLDTNK